jgi:hypothetical protein
MRKVFHLEKNEIHFYYGSLKAIFNSNKDLNVSIDTLYRWDFSIPYTNDKCIIRIGVLLSSSEAIK